MRHFLAGLALACLASAVDADLFVSAASRHAVVRFNDAGEYLGAFVEPGAGGLGNPQGITFGPDGHLYVASKGSQNVLRFDGQTGAFIDVFATRDGMEWPAEINFHGDHLYVSNFARGGGVYRFDAETGEFIDVIGKNIPLADGQSWDGDGNLYVSSFNTRGPGSGAVYKIPAGETEATETVAPGTGKLAGALDNLFLPNGDLLVVSFQTNDVKRFSPEGELVGTIDNINGPQGSEVGPDGALYLGSYKDGVIYRYDLNALERLGVFATASGTTTNNFTFSPADEDEADQGADKRP